MRYLLAIFIAILLSGCAEPLAENQKEFVGLWKSNQTSLLITQSGRLEYETQKGSAKTTISMPIKRISDSEIVAGLLIFTSTLKIQGKPQQDEGLLTLMVDDEKLYKTDELGRIPHPTELPALEELRLLITDELRLLAGAINKNDFSDYLRSTSHLYQSQFSNEKMLELYKPFTEQEIDINFWMEGDFILTEEPRIDEIGVLRVSGKYLTTPKSLKFTMSYLHSDTGWKSIGPNVTISDS